jgi:hypothetical protein
MRKELLTGTVSLLSCLNLLSSISSMSLHSGFQNRFIFNPFCSNTLTILIVFPDYLDHRIFEIKFPTHVKFSFFHFLFVISEPSFLYVTVVILSCKQSPVNCSSRKVKSNFMHKANHSCYCHFPGLKFM